MREIDADSVHGEEEENDSRSPGTNPYGRRVMHRVRAMLKNCKHVMKSHFPPVVKLRRISQILFLALFVWLVAWIKSISSAGTDANPANPANFFFKFDPLLALANGLAGSRVLSGTGMGAGHPDSDLHPGTILLRLDLSHGQPEPFSRQHRLQSQKSRGANQIKSL